MNIPKKDKRVARRRSDRSFVSMIVVTIVIIGAVFFSNSRIALHPELQTVSRIDVKRVKERIEKAGLTPREAKYYRVLE
ncbi:hypothetical protein AMJ40_07240 [candidate division TA06 bacterium DG_26]|uniref:Uncharacterized protein n=1 Tax=candidate division TA06 bacterium DG_26 TaxID=1703771 RepID=A0A0S7WG25_UNCT6|nr:MAG: hypothetical protein AMJ40_07240 [candidate division TA06 bacterium DG_26]